MLRVKEIKTTPHNLASERQPNSPAICRSILFEIQNNYRSTQSNRSI